MSKRFRFAFQTILEDYTQVEHAKRIRLLFAQRVLHEAARDAMRLGEWFRTHAQTLGSHPMAPSTEFGTYSAHLEYLDCAIRQRVTTVRSCQSNVEREKSEFVEAAKTRNALETLKLRRAKAYAAAQRILEERELDESNRAVRGSQR